MRICVGRFYTNDESSLVVFVQHLQYYSGVVLHGELYAKPNGRLVDYGKYKVHNSDNWKEFKDLNSALTYVPVEEDSPCLLQISH